MSQLGPPTTDENAEMGEPALRSAADSFHMLGLVLAPIAALLMVLALIQAIYGIAHELSLTVYPANPNGISTTRRDVTVLYNLAAGLTGPLAAALLWFDWIGSGMSRRSRISLIGYLCGTIAAMALFLIVNPAGVI
jgi:disulfide bond formation protein DsbB